jgi:hypothetical protein
MQVWLDKIFPYLKGFMAALDSVDTYMLLYSGVILTNLLEVTLLTTLPTHTRYSL